MHHVEILDFKISRILNDSGDGAIFSGFGLAKPLERRIIGRGDSGRVPLAGAEMYPMTMVSALLCWLACLVPLEYGTSSHSNSRMTVDRGDTSSIRSDTFTRPADLPSPLLPVIEALEETALEEEESDELGLALDFSQVVSAEVNFRLSPHHAPISFTVVSLAVSSSPVLRC